MSTAPAYDLILQGGHVICPASGIDGVMDVAVSDGKIAAVAKSILPSSAKKVTDVRGKLVLPGMIDTHAHVYKYVTGRFGLDADMCGVDSGVTTLVDQGGPSCMTLPGFRHFIVEPAKTRVVAFISAYLVGGMEGHYYPELYAPNCLDPKALHIPGGRNPHFISEHAGKVSFTHVSARGERSDRELGVEILGDPLLDFGDCGLFGRCS